MIKTVAGSKEEIFTVLGALKESLRAIGENMAERSRELTQRAFGEPLSPAQVVERILGDVARMGDKAVLDYTGKLDGATLTRETMRVDAGVIEEAHRKVSAQLLDAMRRAARNIERFQRAVLVSDPPALESDGIRVRHRYVPIKRVGIWVPGWSAPLVSTLLMTAIPAKVAGVEQIAVFTPPGSDGTAPQAVLAACRELDIDEVYRIQGVAAVGAMAYGTETIRPVDMVAGPGNVFVTLAKLSVFGRVGIDMPAGPSEVAIVADSSSDVRSVAASMLAQAEHYPGSAVTIALDRKLADDLSGELQREAARLERGRRALECLEDFGLVVLAAGREEALEIVAFMAPEHLEVQCGDAAEFAGRVRNAGAVFVGPFTPTALGDYFAGPSHTLPTGSSARFMSGLSANSFRRSFAVVEATENGLARAAPSVKVLAEAEGLTAHARSVDVRLEK